MRKVPTAIIFGKGRVAIKAAELLIRASYHIQFIVPSTRELPNDESFEKWASQHGLESRSNRALDDIAFPSTDLGISVYFDQIFRKQHIGHFKLLLNVHNSLLPKYRGVRPINWALKNGETHHGVTLHQITSGIDEGPILAQEKFEIDPEVDEVKDVYWRCIAAAERMLTIQLPKIAELPSTPQDEKAASYYSSADDQKLGERRFWTRNDYTLE